ncbi:hypothetical protein U8527_12730 [Kordia algicida OT-1]|uniref:Uncharacterized protein n=1 Tax=Kordia algicida OT-1 TaxID=391587 RepID=A9ED28_9FLAO|nr:hypothetical protein [Kordia algicida]EDP94270.1 hypothetical protein KAOT1_06302 [Kordia algicida OT-1]
MTQKKEENSKVILVMIAGFLIISAYLEFYTEKQDLAKYIRYVALGVGAASFFPPLERLVVWIWDKIALVLGWINTKIILSVVFFVLLTPFGVLSRLFSKSNLKLKNDSNTTFVERNHTYTKKDLENIW